MDYSLTLFKNIYDNEEAYEDSASPAVVRIRGCARVRTPSLSGGGFMLPAGDTWFREVPGVIHNQRYHN